MKIIYHNKQIWNDPKFRNTPAWAKALYFYIYDNCDPAGFWDIDMGFAQAFLNLEETKTIDEVQNALRGRFLWQPKDDLFLVKSYIDQTQVGEYLLPSQPANVKVFEAMAERSRDGLENVVDIITKANPELKFGDIAIEEPQAPQQKNALKKARKHYEELKLINTTQPQASISTENSIQEQTLSADF
jgi:hypothetical protein|tara:strand:- start:440 stop:1000 length:561 start_codon:yes stop_codon:yes gene_type:complete